MNVLAVKPPSREHALKNARQVALLICQQVIENGQSLNQQLEIQLVKLTVERDKGLTSELSYGVCRYYYLLCAELKSLIKKPLKSKDRDVLLILLLGLYQIRFMRVENHAAVNETVKLLKSTKKPWAKGLVNGVLRNYVRQFQHADQHSIDQLDDLEHQQSYPDWIKNKIQQDWGEYDQAILKAGNSRAPMVLRIDLNQITRNEYLKQLQDVSIIATEHPVIEQAVVLEKPVAVELLPGFDQGLSSVQDASAQIASTLLDSQPGMRVLDACAAPGGKTLHILQATKNIQMTALDKDALRLNRITENLDRSGVTAHVLCADASETDVWFDGNLYDRILLDAPCSASGIIRRHPDIRVLRQAGDIEGLVKQQKILLNALWPLLKPGGRLLYSTCSIFKDENENQVLEFIRTQSDCIKQSLNNEKWGIKRPVGRQVLPGFNNMDGFYYACLEKQV